MIKIPTNVITLGNQDTISMHKTSKPSHSWNSESDIDSSLLSLEKIKENEDKYLNRENESLLRSYGKYLYSFSNHIDSNLPTQNFLDRHKIAPDIRTKMVDWMIEVFNAYCSEDQTFFICVQLLDSYISRCPCILTNNSIHLLGITCMFIASKFEDEYPIQMYHAQQKIGHNKFSVYAIKQKEKEILECLNFDIVYSTMLDFINLYFQDFITNNVSSKDILDVLTEQKEIAIFLAKMMNYYDGFSHLCNSVKAVCCVSVALDLVKGKAKLKEEKEDTFYRGIEELHFSILDQWVTFLKDSLGKGKERVEPTIYKIKVYYQENYEGGFANMNNLLKHR